MSHVCVAGSSTLAADAGAHVADAGGNAVDAALATAIVSMITEPGIVSLAGGAFITVLPPHGEATVVDGYVEMPGRGVPPERFGDGGTSVTTEYGGGVTTIIGPGSVAVPGTPAALENAWKAHGTVPWHVLLEPAIEIARGGFALGAAASHYLGYVHESIFGLRPDSHAALHDQHGRLVPEGETVVIAGLEDSLRAFAEDGARTFYEGDVAVAIVADMEAGGGLVTADDLRAYRSVVRTPTSLDLDGWRIETNPVPAIGGVTLAAMLRLMGDVPVGPWTDEDVARLARVQQVVLGYRRTHLEANDELAEAAAKLLAAAGVDDVAALSGAPSTIHASAADTDGRACAVTSSAGYGSGVMASGTGIWLNNCLGESELNPRGFHALPPGARLTSNMAPTVGRHRDGRVLAIGSPGADRITTAILAVLLNLVRGGMPLDVAVAHPRLHVVVGDGHGEAIHEDGLPVDAVPLPTRSFGPLHMMFGGVAAAMSGPDGLEAAADPRRTGGTATGGTATSGR